MKIEAMQWITLGLAWCAAACSAPDEGARNTGGAAGTAGAAGTSGTAGTGQVLEPTIGANGQAFVTGLPYSRVAGRVGSFVQYTEDFDGVGTFSPADETCPCDTERRPSGPGLSCVTDTIAPDGVGTYDLISHVFSSTPRVNATNLAFGPVGELDADELPHLLFYLVDVGSNAFDVAVYATDGACDTDACSDQEWRPWSNAVELGGTELNPLLLARAVPLVDGRVKVLFDQPLVYPIGRENRTVRLHRPRVTLDLAASEVGLSGILDGDATRAALDACGLQADSFQDVITDIRIDLQVDPKLRCDGISYTNGWPLAPARLGAPRTVTPRPYTPCAWTPAP